MRAKPKRVCEKKRTSEWPGEKKRITNAGTYKRGRNTIRGNGRKEGNNARVTYTINIYHLVIVWEVVFLLGVCARGVLRPSP